MRLLALFAIVCSAAAVFSSAAMAQDSYERTINLFKNAGESADVFSSSYAYAVFPTIGSGALGIGGAFGRGRVYVAGQYRGDTTMGQISLGFQAGGKAYSEIIFFQDKRALDQFESGSFEFGADASAVAVTAAANAGAATNGASAGVSVAPSDATTRGGGYNGGMAVFTLAKGGLMFSAAVAGQKFSYTPRETSSKEGTTNDSPTKEST